MTRVSLPHSSFSFLSQGAIIQEFALAGHNLVLSFPSAEPYPNAPYFGETIGRVANRISKGLIQELNGRSYQLTANLNGENHLHGGTVGWGHRTFSEPLHLTRDGKDAIFMTYTSPDGEEGYPGTVELRVWYTMSETNGTAVLEIEYEAELVGNECEETVVNITNHSYFNIGTGPTIEDTKVQLATNDFLVMNASQIPTGDIAKFPDIQPHEPFVLGLQEPQIDNCFVVDKNVHDIPLDTRQCELTQLALAHHPSSGIHLEVSGTEPCFQFYTGDYVDVPESEHGPARPPRAGFCVEPGRYINAINMPEWKNQVLLRRGQTWGSRIVYKAWEA